jgi:ABC-2 type transport system permease protein
MTLKKYFSLAKTNLAEIYSNFLESSVYVLFLIFILFIFIRIWTIVYSGKSAIEGFSLTEMLWYFAFTETLVLSFNLYRITALGEEIKTGALSNSLLKPYNFIGREFSLVSSSLIFNFILFGAAATIMTYIFIGPINLTFFGLAATFVTIILAMLLNFCIMSSIGFVALWTEESSSLYWMYQKIIFVLGGMLIPLEFYPDWLRGVLNYLPTSFIVYGPAKLFVHFSFLDFIKLIAGQIFWIAIAFMIMILIYTKGIRKVSINGG